MAHNQDMGEGLLAFICTAFSQASTITGHKREGLSKGKDEGEGPRKAKSGEQCSRLV